MTKTLEILLRWLDTWLRRKEARNHQNEYEAIQDDPALWMRKHFNGLHSDDAKGSDKTDIK